MVRNVFFCFMRILGAHRGLQQAAFFRGWLCLKMSGTWGQEISHYQDSILVFTKWFSRIWSLQNKNGLFRAGRPWQIQQLVSIWDCFGKGNLWQGLRSDLLIVGTLNSVNNLFLCLSEAWGEDSHLPSPRKMSGQRTYLWEKQEYWVHMFL